MKTAKKKKLKWQQYIGMAFMMLIGAVCGFLMVMFVDRFSEDTPIHVEVLSLIGLFIGMYVSIFFHLIMYHKTQKLKRYMNKLAGFCINYTWQNH